MTPPAGDGFVELDEARADPGLRLVISGTVPSPWSQAAKGACKLAGLSTKIVRHVGDVAAINAWTGTDNVPVALYAKEPARTAATAIVGLLARLAPGTLLSDDPRTRADTMGHIDLVAGDGGLGWNTRLVIIDAGLRSDGQEGFPARVAAYLAPRYGYDPATHDEIVPRLERQLAALDARLGAASFFGGDRPDALDVYVATFLTILTPLTESDCPGMPPRMRVAFGTAAQKIAPLVPASLFAQRARMFERWLDWPIRL